MYYLRRDSSLLLLWQLAVFCCLSSERLSLCYVKHGLCQSWGVVRWLLLAEFQERRQYFPSLLRNFGNRLPIDKASHPADLDAWKFENVATFYTLKFENVTTFYTLKFENVTTFYTLKFENVATFYTLKFENVATFYTLKFENVATFYTLKFENVATFLL